MSRNDHELPPIIGLYNPEQTTSVERPADEPAYPILHKSEVNLDKAHTLRLREQLPEDVRRYLSPEEKVVHIRQHEIVLPEAPLTPDEVLRRAAGAPTINEIGYHGSTVASVNIFDSAERSRYQDEHGRDALIAAEDSEPVYSELLTQTIISLAESQGVDNEPYTPGQPYGFEKPGSIILVNKNPDDPVARKFMRLQKWKYPFYASADAPGRFINAIARKYQQDSGILYRGYNSRKGYVAPLKEAFELSSQWHLDRARENAEGLIEYKNLVKSGGGMRHQGWRDGAGAMVHADGSWANSELGIASMEVLAVSFDACMNAAEIYRSFDEDKDANEAKAQEFEEAAYRIQNYILENGWVDDPTGGYFALGFDRDENGRLRPLQVKTPMPDLLRSGLLKTDNPDIQEMVYENISNLLTPDVLTRWGLRSMSARAVAFGPMRYHGGRIWGHINDGVAAGMSDHGFYGVDRFLGGLTSKAYEILGCFPETFEGKNSEVPELSSRDTYVYNELYDEVYLFEQTPPLGQTWDATAEIAKRERYKYIPLYAEAKRVRELEAKFLKTMAEIVHST